jgi:hypothetical protein
MTEKAGEKEEKKEPVDRAKLLENLEDATRRLQDEEAAKKRDAAVHREEIASIKAEIAEIMEQLED